MKRNKTVQDTQQLQKQPGGCGSNREPQKLPAWAWWAIGGAGGDSGRRRLLWVPKYPGISEYIAMVDRALNVDYLLYRDSGRRDRCRRQRLWRKQKALLEKHYEISLLPDVKIKAVYGQKGTTVDNTRALNLLWKPPWKKPTSMPGRRTRHGTRFSRGAGNPAEKLRGKAQSLTPMRKRLGELVKIEEELNCESYR